MKIHPDAQEGLVLIGDLTVPFYDTGAPYDARPTVVLVHGTGGSASTHFRTLFPMLTTRYRVIALDLQTTNGDLSLGYLSAQVSRVIDERAPNQGVHLVGYSLGALVAADLAADRPATALTLTLVAGWVRAGTQQKLRNRIWQRLFETDDSLLREFATLTAYGPPFLASKTDSEIQALIEARQFPAGIAEQMKLNRDADLSDKLPKVLAPTLVIAGSYDQMVPDRQSKLLFGGIANARYAVIESGHAVPQERPAQLFQIINEFLTIPEAFPRGQVQERIHI